MTPAEHNKVLGILMLVHAGLRLLIMGALSVFLLAFPAFVKGLAAHSHDANPEELQQAMAAFGPMFTLMVGLTVTVVLGQFLIELLAGIALLQRRRWARVVGIIAALIDLLDFPLGSALGAYALWFLLGQRSRAVYEVQPAP